MRFLGSSLLIFWLAGPATVLAGSRIKDVATVSGARENQLVGYGLVVGLAGDGDKDPVYTVQSIANTLQRFGVSVPAGTLSSKNVAAVMVTADIPPLPEVGQSHRCDGFRYRRCQEFARRRPAPMPPLWR